MALHTYICHVYLDESYTGERNRFFVGSRRFCMFIGHPYFNGGKQSQRMNINDPWISISRLCYFCYCFFFFIFIFVVAFINASAKCKWPTNKNKSFCDDHLLHWVTDMFYGLKFISMHWVKLGSIRSNLLEPSIPIPDIFFVPLAIWKQRVCVICVSWK